MGTVGYIVLAVVCWVVVMSVIASILAVVDKKRAERGKWRISEATLLLFGFLGGAAAEFAVMRKIHHKTKHMRFMLGLPCMIVAHFIIIGICVYFYTGGKLPF